MALYSGCILYPEQAPPEAIKISIMSRHTLNDGVTTDQRIPRSGLVWLRQLAPPDRLVGDYYKRGLPWDEFAKKYLEHLNQPKTQKFVKLIANLAINKDLIVLCIEETPKYCHRRLLLEYIQKLYPNLPITIS